MPTPWMNSDQLIAAVKRKIALPISQITFSEDDILAFLNEEMMISQVPSVLQFHEEFYVFTKEVEIRANKSRYPIPERAIGMKLRDLFYKDTSGNVFEMVRVSPDDKAYYQFSNSTNSLVKYYLEGNDVVLVPNVNLNASGSLVFSYFIRPNQLVSVDRSATIDCFTKNIIIADNASIAPGDTIIVGDYTFTAVSGSPSSYEFQIGASSIATATNIVSSVNLTSDDSELTATNGSPATNTVTICYNNVQDDVSVSNTTAMTLQTSQGIQFTDTVPSIFTDGEYIDFLQTKPGHRIRSIDIRIPHNSISTNIISFTSSDVPDDLEVGDYICLANECVIPYLPTDLHNGLAERACARILAAQGDKDGLASVNEKISEIETRQGTLLDNRVDGSPQKITGRKSILTATKMGSRRRY